MSACILSRGEMIHFDLDQTFRMSLEQRCADSSFRFRLLEPLLRPDVGARSESAIDVDVCSVLPREQFQWNEPRIPVRVAIDDYLGRSDIESVIGRIESHGQVTAKQFANHLDIDVQRTVASVIPRRRAIVERRKAEWGLVVGIRVGHYDEYARAELMHLRFKEERIDSVPERIPRRVGIVSGRSFRRFS